MTCFIILLCGCLFHLALLKYFVVKKRKGGEKKEKKNNDVSGVVIEII